LDVVGLPFVLTIRLSELNDIANLAEISEQFLRNKLFEYSSYSAKIYNYTEARFEIGLMEELVAAASLAKNAQKASPVNAGDLFSSFKSSGQGQHVVRLQMKWNNAWNNNIDEAKSAGQLRIETNLEDIKDMSRMREARTNLHDCMRLFTEPETLTSENPWYCSSCKEHQKARKQMSLWRLPKYLIITLKRFHAHKASDAPKTSNTYLNYLIQNRLAYNKLNTFIEYPIKYAFLIC